MATADGDVGVAVSVGVGGGSSVTVTRDGGDSRRDQLGSVSVSRTAADLPGHLLVDGLADLPGDGGALLHGSLHGDSEGDGPTALSRHGHAVGLRDLPEDCVALGDRLRSTDGVGHVSLEHSAGLSGHRGTLGDSDTLGDGDTVRGDDLWGETGSVGDVTRPGPLTLGDWDTDRDLHTVRDSHTLGHWDTHGHGLAGGGGHGTAGLDWDTSALSLHLLLALRGNNSDWGHGTGDTNGSHGSRDSNGGGDSNRSDGGRYSKRSGGGSNTDYSTTNTKSTESVEKELRISLSLGLGVTLDDKPSWVETQSANKRTNSSSWSSKAESLNSRNSRGSDHSGVVDDLLGHTDLSLDLLAHVGDDVLALLPEGGLWDDPGLGGALLLTGALLLCGAPLCLSALGLGEGVK